MWQNLVGELTRLEVRPLEQKMKTVEMMLRTVRQVMVVDPLMQKASSEILPNFVAVVAGFLQPDVE